MIKVDGALLKEYRKKKGLTQVQLAEGICEQATVSNIENKNMSPGINILSALCKKLNVEISDILVETEEDKIRKKINEIQSLNSVSKYQESYKILQTIDQEKVSNSDLLNQILFYQGLLIIFMRKNQMQHYFILIKCWNKRPKQISITYKQLQTWQ